MKLAVVNAGSTGSPFHTSFEPQVGRIWEVSLQHSLSDSGLNTGFASSNVAAAIGCGSFGEKRGGGLAHFAGEKTS